MKKLFILLTILVSCIAAQAQWSVGLDARIAPWGSDNKKHMGTDITLNYRLPVSSFYVMPSVGLFYTNFFEEADWDGGKCYGNSGYQTGFDFALVVGKSFGVVSVNYPCSPDQDTRTLLLQRAILALIMSRIILIGVSALIILSVNLLSFTGDE